MRVPLCRRSALFGGVWDWQQAFTLSTNISQVSSQPGPLGIGAPRNLVPLWRRLGQIVGSIPDVVCAFFPATHFFPLFSFDSKSEKKSQSIRV